MDNQQVRLMKVVLLVTSVVSFALLASAAYQENFGGQWRDIQRSYKTLLIETAGDDNAERAAQTFQVEHKQLYLAELEAIDRCTTCHLGVENPAMADADLPHRTHSGDLLANHPTETFGCTVCHQGQGRAVAKHKAHGWNDDGTLVKHAETPLLRDQAVYTSCGKCHSEIDLYGGQSDLFAQTGPDAGEDHQKPVIDEAAMSQTLPGADAVTAGKKLVVQSGCLGCHKYRGRGGVLGPDITYVGDKTKHDFGFAHVEGEHTVDQWLFEHFIKPSEVSPDTLMPDIGLDETQARQLTAYMMSLHRKTALASHTPQTAGAVHGRVEPVRGETLYRMYCSACHGPDGAGTTLRGGLWPTDADPWGHDWDARNVVVESRSDLEVMVPSLNHPDTLATASDDYLRHVITDGRAGTKMLGWADEGGLTGDEITLLVDFIRRWQPDPPAADRISSSRGDPRVGGALYRANCASCHGSEGQGAIANTLNSPTFLAVASDAFLRDTIVHGRTNTAMPAWREFDAQEISDLLAFIRQWQPTRSTVAGALQLASADESPEVSAAIGQTLYGANCVMCHGQDGGGDLAPSLNTQAFLTVVPNEYLLDTLIEGRAGTGMPSWRHLPDKDLASIVKYIRTWQTEQRKPPAWYEQTVVRGDRDAGRILFEGTCAGCHGTQAEGASGPQLNNPNFLKNASDVMLSEWISRGKPGTEMLGFRKGGQGIAELTDRQIEDVVAFLRSLELKGEAEIARVAKSPHGRPEKGAALFVNNCAGCHGPQGQGASGPALSNADFLRSASDGFLMATMAMGRSGTEMRPVKRGPQSILGLTSDEVNDVVAFLRSWEFDSPFQTAGAAPAIPHRYVIPWDFDKGRQLFNSNCAGCHGVEGKGNWAPELNNEGFLAAATDGFLQATIVRGRKGTAMRPFGTGGHGIADLTSDDVDDIVAYIRHWSAAAPSPMTVPAERTASTPTQTKSPAQPAAHDQQAKTPTNPRRNSSAVLANRPG